MRRTVLGGGLGLARLPNVENGTGNGLLQCLNHFHPPHMVSFQDGRKNKFQAFLDFYSGTLSFVRNSDRLHEKAW